MSSPMLPWVALALTQGSLLANGDFEAKPAKDAPIAGWTVDVGARNAGNEPLSELVLDKVDKHGGKQSLRLAGNDKTRAWQIVKQEVAVRPGAKCTLRAWAKADKVRPEKVDGTIPQFQNGYVALLLLDRGDEIVSKGYAHVKRPTSSWTELTVELDAPATARRARVMLFLSMSGKLWIDDVKLEVAGGTDAPKPSLVFSEGFENATAVPPEWKEEEGAMNGAREPRSTIAIDASVGAPGSPRSLRLEGDGSTRLWYALRRAFPAQPGDVVALAARVKAEDVHREGIQFANFHLHVFFKDKDGKTMTPVAFAHPGQGTYDWKSVSVEATAPDGAVEAGVGVFLSMSGKAWIDSIEATQEGGGSKPYADWTSLDSKHLVLRFSKSDPRAGQMEVYGKRLDETFERICERVGVKHDEKITAFLYRDGDAGRRMTGRDLDFADPSGVAFHQTLDSTLGHEMTHVILRKIGNAQVALLGEGVAVYLNGAPPKVHHERASRLLAEEKLPSLDALLNRFREEPDGYPAAGSFCGFVIETYGMEKFKLAYPQGDLAAAAKPIFGVSLEEIDAKWRASLATADPAK